MKLEKTSIESQDLIALIKKEIADAHLNDNDFYYKFKTTRLPLLGIKEIFQQYYYYIRTFPQILAGLSHRVENELVRKKLARTVVSELGDGKGIPHFLMFEKVLASIGVTLDDYRKYKYIPEAAALVDGLKNLFLIQHSDYALGAHYVIEEIGLPMIVALYDGFRQYQGWKTDDFSYFYLHMLVEGEHVDWIQEAVLTAAQKPEARKRIEIGARCAIQLLNNFWNGLARLVDHHQKTHSYKNKSFPYTLSKKAS